MDSVCRAMDSTALATVRCVGINQIRPKSCQHSIWISLNHKPALWQDTAWHKCSMLMAGTEVPSSSKDQFRPCIHWRVHWRLRWPPRWFWSWSRRDWLPQSNHNTDQVAWKAASVRNWQSSSNWWNWWTYFAWPGWCARRRRTKRILQAATRRGLEKMRDGSKVVFDLYHDFCWASTEVCFYLYSESVEVDVPTGIWAALSLALECYFLGCRSLDFKVESDDFCRQVLARRQQDGFLHCGPIHEDVRKFTAEAYPASGILAGFPCQARQHLFPILRFVCFRFQDISQAGSQAGLAGARSSLVAACWKIYDTLPPARRQKQFQCL